MVIGSFEFLNNFRKRKQYFANGSVLIQEILDWDRGKQYRMATLAENNPNWISIPTLISVDWGKLKNEVLLENSAWQFCVTVGLPRSYNGFAFSPMWFNSKTIEVIIRILWRNIQKSNLAGIKNISFRFVFFKGSCTPSFWSPYFCGSKICQTSKAFQDYIFRT